MIAAMIDPALRVIGRLLRGLLHASRIAKGTLWQWLLAALVGLGLGLLLWLSLPQTWRSEGHLILKPLVTFGASRGLHPVVANQDPLLTIDEMGGAYAWQLRSDERLARVAKDLGWNDSPVTLRAYLDINNEGDGILQVRATHSDPGRAEQLVAAVLRDFDAGIRAQNRQRIDIDRIDLTRTAVTLPVSTRPPLEVWAGIGAICGALLGLLGVLAREAVAGRRVATPLDAERITRVPTLAAIPTQRRS